MAVVGLVKELGDGLVVGEYGQSRGRSAAIPDLIEPGLYDKEVPAGREGGCRRLLSGVMSRSCGWDGV